MGAAKSMFFKSGTDPSSRGPGKASAAEDVNMQMIDALAAVFTGVDDQAEPAFRKAFGLCDVPRDGEKMAQKAFVVRFQNRGNVLFGNHQRVNWRGGRNVVKRHAKVVFEYLF